MSHPADTLDAVLRGAHPDPVDRYAVHAAIVANLRRRQRRADAHAAHRASARALVSVLVCRDCGEELPAASFPVDRAKATGRRATCRACIRKRVPAGSQT